MKDIASAFLYILVNLCIELLVIILLPILVPILIYKKYWRALFPTFPFPKHGILIHAASVGEIMGIKQLLIRILGKYPETPVYLSTTTVSGLETAKKIDKRIHAFLSPFDLLHLRIYQMHILKPKVILIAETELWMNFLKMASVYQVPVILLNARISETTLRGYRRLHSLLEYSERSVREIIAQSQDDAIRFRQLFSSKISVADNLKYAVQLPDYDQQKLRRSLGYHEKDHIIVWGSSRPGEEEIALNLHKALSKSIPHLNMIIALRHPNRIDEVKDIFEGYYYSVFSKGESPKPIHIIDVLGMLDQCYAIADLVIVGGSFRNYGGHNPLEPSYYAKPIIMGKYHTSCKASVETLKSFDAITLTDEEHLAEIIQQLYADPARAASMGYAAKEVLNRGDESMNKHLQLLSQWIK